MIKDIESFRNQIIARGSLTFEEARELSSYTHQNLASCFETPLNIEENKIVNSLERKNIGTFAAFSAQTMNGLDPFINIPDRDKVNMLDCVKDSKLSKEDSELVIYCCAIKYTLSLGNTPQALEPKFFGKVPKKNIFCMRQGIADVWFNRYINFALNHMRFVIKYKNYDKKAGMMYIIFNTANYFLKNQPNYFPLQNDEKESTRFFRIYEQVRSEGISELKKSSGSQNINAISLKEYL